MQNDKKASTHTEPVQYSFTEASFWSDDAWKGHWPKAGFNKLILHINEMWALALL